MRVKTDERRQAIVDAASNVFCEMGYERASMGEILARLGGSKATLYSYFKSKEELFVAVINELLCELSGGAFEALHAPGDLRARLLEFGRHYVQVRLSSTSFGIFKAIVAECDRSGVGKLVHEQGFKPRWAEIAQELETSMGRGELRRADSWRAAWHLKGLLEAGLLDQRLSGVISEATPDEIAAQVDAAVDVFMRGYAPEPR